MFTNLLQYLNGLHQLVFFFAVMSKKICKKRTTFSIIVLYFAMLSPVIGQDSAAVVAVQNAPSLPVIFTLEAKISVPDWVEGSFNPLVIPLTVNGLPERMDSTFGLEKIVLTLKHNYISDIKVDLISPDGTDTWITNRNGRDGQDYLDATFSVNGYDGLITENKAPFTGEYIPDGLLQNFNNGQNPNGVWKILIHDLNTGVEGTFEKISFVFSNKPAMAKNAPCTVQHPANCHCSKDSVSSKLLPDLILAVHATANNLWEVPYDPVLGYGGLKFEVRTINIGLGPLEIEGTGTFMCGKDTVNAKTRCEGDMPPRQTFLQNIYTFDPKTNTFGKVKRGAGSIIYDDRAGHHHFHASDYCTYSLLERIEGEPNPDKWNVIGENNKASFCLWDMQFCSETLGNCTDVKANFYHEKNLPNYGLGGFRTCMNGNLQGLSVGGIDYYGLNYEGQTIKIPRGICNGVYYLRITIDPFNRFEESDETNNELLLPVRIISQTPCERQSAVQSANAGQSSSKSSH